MNTTLKTLLSVGIVIVVIIAAIVFAMHAQKDELPADWSAPLSDISDTPKDSLSSNDQATPASSKPMNATTAVFHTSMGNFTIELDTKNTPNTAENFRKLAAEGFYNKTKFHRVIENFMVQGGDPQSADDSKMNLWGTGGPGYKFADEIKPTNKNSKGTISMANSGPNTNGSQFFINVADNNFLDTKHTVFGHVTSGYDVVEKISHTATNDADRPVTAVVITSIEIK